MACKQYVQSLRLSVDIWLIKLRCSREEGFADSQEGLVTITLQLLLSLSSPSTPRQESGIAYLILVNSQQKCLLHTLTVFKRLEFATMARARQ